MSFLPFPDWPGQAYTLVSASALALYALGTTSSTVQNKTHPIKAKLEAETIEETELLVLEDEAPASVSLERSKLVWCWQYGILAYAVGVWLLRGDRGSSLVILQPWMLLIASLRLALVYQPVGWLSHHLSGVCRQSADRYYGLRIAAEDMTFLATLAVFGIELLTPLPVRKARQTGAHEKASLDDKTRTAPLDDGRSLLGIAFWTFVDGSVWRFSRRTAKEEDVPELAPDCKTAAAMLAFRQDTPPHWLGGEEAHIGWRLIWHIRGDLLRGSLLGSVIAISLAASPIVLARLLDTLVPSAEPTDVLVMRGLLYAALFAGLDLLGGIVDMQRMLIGMRAGVKMRAIAMGEIYSKALKRREGAYRSQEADSVQKEQLNEIVSVDCYDLTDLPQSLTWGGVQLVIEIVGVLIACWSLLGLLHRLVSFRPRAGRYENEQEYLGSRPTRWRQEDDGCKRTLAVIPPDQVFCVRVAFQRARVGGTKRGNASTEIRSNCAHFSLPRNVVAGSQILMAAAAYSWHMLILHRPLTASLAFATIKIFKGLAWATDDLANCYTSLMKLVPNLERINRFLREDETEKYDQKQIAASLGVCFRDGLYSWRYDDTFDGSFELRTGDVDFVAGKMTLIVGSVASGKSSLLMALCGEMHQLSGSHHLGDKVALCPQIAHLWSGTVRYNVMGDAEPDLARYNQVLDACALLPDLATFPNGDQTEVGEAGRQTSGGQKARISLARALYSSAQTLLLDDILSAVDSGTAQHLVQHALQGPLIEGRTVLLVTHNVSLCLPLAYTVVTMHQGKVHRVQAASDFVERIASETDLTTISTTKAEEAYGKAETIATEAGDEVQKQGVAQLEVYAAYVRFLGPWPHILILAICFLFAHGLMLSMLLWLRYWTADSDKGDSIFYLQVFIGLSGAAFGFELLKIGLFHWRTFVAGRRIFVRLLDTVLGAKVPFESVPLGRALSRLSGDVYQLDNKDSISGLFCLQDLFDSIVPFGATLVLVPQLTPVYSIALAGLLLVYWLFSRASGDIRRIESASQSPIHNLLIESARGMVTIRAYNDHSRFLRKMISLVDAHCRAVRMRQFQFIWQCASSRIPSFVFENLAAFRSYLIGYLATFAVSIYFVMARTDAALAGFALLIGVEACFKILNSIIHFSLIQDVANAMERVEDFETIPQEPRGGKDPPAHWPHAGEIAFDGFSAAYASHLPNVLEDLTLKVPARSKVAIVGRTGAGKSSVALSLFRFLEASSRSIVIDGENIAQMPLQRLRKALTFIPQEPSLWQGSVRFNLDPTNELDDRAIWSSLLAVGMAGDIAHRHAISSLDQHVEEGGNNFSVGERQCLALARGLLRPSPIPVLDESSASLDDATDRHIQETIRREVSCTVISICHRLQTIIDYDLILVLDQGKLIECDSPSNLLARQDSAFSALVQRCGHAEELKKAAVKERTS